jgi:hypothetical protein
VQLPECLQAPYRSLTAQRDKEKHLVSERFQAFFFFSAANAFLLGGDI